MSQQSIAPQPTKLKIKNKVLQLFPSNRRTQQTYNQAQDLEWIISVPNGLALIGFMLDINITTTGSGMSTTPLSQAVQFLRAYAIDSNNNQATKMDVDQYTLDLYTSFGQWLAEQEGLGTYLSNSGVPWIDPPNVATGASLYGNWKIYAPIPGQLIRVVLSVPNLTTVFGTGMTGGVVNAQLVPILADDTDAGEPRRQFAISAKQYASKTSQFFQGAETAILFSASEWGSKASGIEVGEKLTSEMITRMEDYWQDQLAFFAGTTGSANPDFKAIIDGSTNAVTATFVIGRQLDQPNPVKIGLNAATTIKCIILSSVVDADKVVVSG